jgi:transposase
MPHPYDLVIGLDRSDRKADLHYIAPGSGRRWSQTLDTAPERLHDWLAQLRREHPRARVAVCLEQPAGNLIPFLETYSWLTLYPLNPLALLNYRETFATSRARDDTRDAESLADLLATHHDKLQAWAPEDPLTRRLQQLIVHRRAVVDERTGLTNRLQALLKQYFPQALALCGDELWRPLATAFLLQWPTLQAVQKARPETLKAFYYRHGSRSQKLVAQRLEVIRLGVPLTEEIALLESFTVRVQLICRELELISRTVKEFDRRIAEAFDAHPDRAIFASLPGAGPVLAPRLLASLGAQRERFEDARALQSYSGVAPVTKQSGGKCHVHRRYRCPLFQRQSFHEYAKESLLWCRWAAAYYLQQRLKGASHHTAVRALAYKWQRIIWKCWQTHTPYDDRRYEEALKRAGSPVVKLFKYVELGKSPFKTTARK